MKANKILFSVLAMMLTLALMFSVFSVPAFAHEETSSSAAATTGDGHNHEEEESNLVETIVSLCIIGAIVVIIAVYCIIKREKVGKFVRSIKSEMKKIVWFSWKDTRKNSLVVIVAVVLIALCIGILDLAFHNGIDILYKLFN